jgi:hypothetical protein
MDYPNESELEDMTELPSEHHLVLDGTVCLDDYDDDSITHIRGLVELISDYFD